MNLDFKLPHITGKTQQEQIGQIISYLRQLALQLQAMPELPLPETTDPDETQG